MFWIVFAILEIVLDPSRLCESAPVAFCCECCFLLFCDILWSLGRYTLFLVVSG